MLPILAVLLFAVMGIATLVIDAGLGFTVQRQLESSARTLALEHERFLADAANDPRIDPNDWPIERRNLEADLLGPSPPDTRWDVDATARRSEYSSRVAPRFAFGAMLPNVVLPDGSVQGALSVRELLDARDTHGPGPDAPITSGGLLSTGFQPQATVQLADRPAARVGVADRALGLPGLASVALMEAALPQALGTRTQQPPALTLVGHEVQLQDGTCVGWIIDASRGASVGEVPRRSNIGAQQALSAPHVPDEQSYVPLLRGKCGTANEPEIVGFLDLRRVGDTLVPSGELTHENASPVPAAGASPTLAGGLPQCGVVPSLLCVAAFRGGSS